MVCADDNHKIYHYTRDGQPVNDRGELMVCADDNHKIYHYTRDGQPVNDRGELMVLMTAIRFTTIRVTVSQSMIEVS